MLSAVSNIVYKIKNFIFDYLFNLIIKITLILGGQL